jgi:ribonucleotide reductase beta subunit family protein with ferritin-like domain
MINNDNKSSNTSQIEPISIKDDSRYCLKPIKYERIFQMYKEQQDAMWFAEEVDITVDKDHYQKLNKDEQYFIKQILGFFAVADSIVLENLATRFGEDLAFTEAQCFLAIQACIESVHMESYNAQIDAIIEDAKEKDDLFHSIETCEVSKAKFDWAKKWTESKDTLAHRLVAFACVEGIFFSSSFASIFWFRTRQILPGICFANEKISEDEALHVRFTCHVYKTLIKYKLSTEEVHAIVDEAVKIEHKFVEDILPNKLKGMNADLLKDWVCVQADTVLNQLGVPLLYKVKNPLNYMEGFLTQGKTNFFEKRVGEYVSNSKDTAIRTIVIDNLGTDF